MYIKKTGAQIKPQSLNKLKRILGPLSLVLTDICTLLIIFKFSLFMRTEILPFFYSGFPADPPFKNMINLFWVAAVWLFFLFYEGLYTKRFSFWDEIEALIKVSFFATAAVFATISIGKVEETISRTLVILMGLFAVVVFPLIRIPMKRYLHKVGILNKRVLIIGASQAGQRIAQALAKEPNYGYTIVGFLDDGVEIIGRKIGNLKVHRGIDKISSYARRCKVNDIFIALPDAERVRARDLITNLQHKMDRVFYVPDMPGVVAAEASLVHFFHEQVFAFEIRNNMSRPFNVMMKRCVDIILASAAIIILCIPFLVLILIIRLDSKGPAIFRQTRVGKAGRSFGCYKLRTMHIDADQRLGAIIASDAAIREEWECFRKLKNDPRVTRVGKFLRSSSLDELTQLFNVLIGDMSIVGPRPVLQDEIDRYYKDMAGLCFSVPPGITGLWQVSGRNDKSYDHRVALDVWYVKNWHLWLDVVIILRTIRAILKADGAY
jgi:Undecaprenyl-phosphate galactose phosphotransferase WbaP